MRQDATATLAQAHRTLAEGAEQSKRTISSQRRLLRAQMQALDDIERLATQLGMRLRVNDTAQRGHSRDRHT